MRYRAFTAWLALGALVAPATYAEGSPPAQEEKLPVHLPTVTVQGEDRSRVDAGGGLRVAPTSERPESGVRLPEPGQRRATAEENKGLMVSVTPTTVEAPAPLPQPRMPFTAVWGGWGPVLQYRAGMYDARWLGPLLAVSELESQAGWGWTGWRGREWLDWPGVGRLGGRGEGFTWEIDRGARKGGQSGYVLAIDLGQSSTWTGTLRHDRGLATATGLSDLAVQRTGLHTEWRPLGSGGTHQPLITLTAQHRIWGRQAGPEGYLKLQDTWGLADGLALEWGLGGGHWGREPILDPSFTFHYRPTVLTHLFTGLKAESELPDFEGLYLRRPAAAPNDNLDSERVEGWATLGGSHRMNERLWGRVVLDLRRSWRHVFWADAERDGLWTPLNAAGEQWTPRVDGELQWQWHPNWQQNLRYRGRTTQPLGTVEHRVSTGLDGSLPGPAAPVACGFSLAWQHTALSALQIPGGGQATGLFAEADLRYPLTADLSVGLRAADVPLSLSQLSAPNYYAPAPLLALYGQYLF